MHTTLRNAGITCAATVAAAAIAVSTATSAGAASSAVIIGGISVPSMHDLLMAPLLGGAFKDQERISVSWPAEAGPYTGRGDKTLGASIAIGKANMHAAIREAYANLDRDANGNIVEGQKVTVVGLSAGALVVDEVIRDLAGQVGAPSVEHLTFVVAADSSRQKLIDKTKHNAKYDYTYQPAPTTGYDVVVVTGEYDGMADFPDRPWNFLALANAIIGGIVVHVPSTYADLTKVPDSNITIDTNDQGGTTTHYLVPTKKLPIVTLLPFLAPREAELKAKIDKAYSRNDVKTTSARAAVSGVPATVARTLSAPIDTDTTAASKVADKVEADTKVADKVEVESKVAKDEAKVESKVDARAAAKAAAQDKAQARAEAKQAAKTARAEARQAKAEAKQAKADAAKQAKAEAKQSKTEAKQSTKNLGSSDSKDSSE